MVSAKVFLAGIDESIAGLEAGIADAKERITANKNEVAAKTAERRARIRRYAIDLLPDLAPGTIDALATRLPGFIDRNRVAQAIVDARAVHERRLRELGTVDADTIRTRCDLIDADVATQRREQTSVREALDELLAIDGVGRLVRFGYGSGRYPYHWWNGQFYRDWRAADAAAEHLGLKSWPEVRARHDAYAHSLETIAENITRFGNERDGLQAKLRQRDDIRASIEAAPQTVLEQLRVKLEARLDTEEPPPGWMSEIMFANAALRDLHDKNRLLEASREQLTTDLNKLRTLRGRVTASRKQEVPENFVRAVRVPAHARPTAAAPSRSATVRAGGRTASAQTTSSPSFVHADAYHHHDDFLTGAMYGQMHSYFEPAPEPARQASNHGYGSYGSSGGGHAHSQRSNWDNQASNDYSGRS